MMDVLQGIAYGIVSFAIIVVVGTVVITRLGGSVAVCATDYTFDTATNKCLNATSEDPTDPTNTAWVGSNYLTGQLGSSALAGWVPAIIAVAVGALFLSYFMSRRRR